MRTRWWFCTLSPPVSSTSGRFLARARRFFRNSHVGESLRDSRYSVLLSKFQALLRSLPRLGETRLRGRDAATWSRSFLRLRWNADRIGIGFKKLIQFLLSSYFRFKVDIDHKPFVIGQLKPEHHEAVAPAVRVLVLYFELDWYRGCQ